MPYPLLFRLIQKTLATSPSRRFFQTLLISLFSGKGGKSVTSILSLVPLLTSLPVIGSRLFKLFLRANTAKQLLKTGLTTALFLLPNLLCGLHYLRRQRQFNCIRTYVHYRQPYEPEDNPFTTSGSNPRTLSQVRIISRPDPDETWTEGIAQLSINGRIHNITLARTVLSPSRTTFNPWYQGCQFCTCRDPELCTHNCHACFRLQVHREQFMSTFNAIMYGSSSSEFDFESEADEARSSFSSVFFPRLDYHTWQHFHDMHPLSPEPHIQRAPPIMDWYAPTPVLPPARGVVAEATQRGGGYTYSALC